MTKKICTQGEVEDAKEKWNHPDIPIVPPPYDTRFKGEKQRYDRDSSLLGVVEWFLIILGVGGFLAFLGYEFIITILGPGGNMFVILLGSIWILVWFTKNKK